MNLKQLIQAMEDYFYQQVDAGADPDEVLNDLKSIVKDDMALIVEAYKASK